MTLWFTVSLIARMFSSNHIFAISVYFYDFVSPKLVVPETTCFTPCECSGAAQPAGAIPLWRKQEIQHARSATCPSDALVNKPWIIFFYRPQVVFCLIHTWLAVVTFISMGSGLLYWGYTVSTVLIVIYGWWNLGWPIGNCSFHPR